MIISRLITVAKKYYLKRKKMKILARFRNNATIGSGFEVELGANIKNESGDKQRIKIGNNCKIMGLLVCKAAGQITVGNFSWIEENVNIMCLTQVSIGSFCGIAAGTTVSDNNNHPVEVAARIRHRITVAPGGAGYPGLGNGWELSDSAAVVIGDGVWIGGNCTILKGVTIGDGAVVARASVVTRDVAPFTIVAGNPAQKVKELSRPSESISQIAERIMQEKSL